MQRLFTQSFVLVLLLAPTTLFAATDNTTWLTTASATLDPAMLPLSDGKFSATTPAIGVVYACDPEHTYTITQTGARTTGNWLHGKTWSLVEKIAAGAYVHGSTTWPDASLSIAASEGIRILSTNDLPQGQPTGIFPIQKSDPAYKYDRNPNAITAQSYSISVPITPTAGTPTCVPHGPVGIGLDGVVFFSSIDSHGRDEPAYELQDYCGGMSAPSGIYHRYLPSLCIPHIQEPNALVGYALDGFGIYSPYDANGVELTTKDLDECHGTTTPVLWDGKRVSMYHYVLTRDFPYNISCFRGTPQYIHMPPPPSKPWHAVLIETVRSNTALILGLILLTMGALWYRLRRRTF